jgi:hypothetical protein
MVAKRRTRAKKAGRSKKADLTSKVKKAVSMHPPIILGTAAYNKYQRLTPEQKAAANKVLLKLALMLI